MAKIVLGNSVNGAVQGFLGDTFDINDLWEYPVIALKKKAITFSYWKDNYVQIKGKHFTYDANGAPTGGTVTSVTVVNDTKGFIATGLAGVSLVDLYQAAGNGVPGAGDTAAFFSLLLAGNDVFTGTALDDHILAGSNPGNDKLNGGLGADIMMGGTGDDTYVVDNAGDVVDETGGDGTDTVQASISFSLSDAAHAKGQIENLTLTGSTALAGTGNSLGNVITGNALDNTLIGNGGDDTLNGGVGADIMIGGGGNDTYIVDNAGDVVDETGGSGIDTVQASITFSLSDGVHAKGAIENLILTGSAAINGTGNALDNVITGNSGNNVLEGLGGADTLIGGAGADTASYAGSSQGVTVSLATGLGSGGDAEGDTLSGIENLTGSGQDDTLAGNGSNNVLVGGLGIDTVSYAGAEAGVTVSLAITSAQKTKGAGTDTFSGFENLTGSSHDDILTGDSGNNVLDGGLGADKLNGGAGDDTLIGGNVITRLPEPGFRPSGNDILTGGIGSDTFVFVLPMGLPSFVEAARTIVTDFESGTDELDLSIALERFGLAGLDYDTLVAQGNLTIVTGNFNTGTQTNSAAIQDTRIYVDADGNGSAPQHLVATLEDALTAADDFLV